MNIFNSLDYKKLLADQAKINRKTYGFKTQLAKAAGCQPAFLSQVMNGSAHLTPEHALGIASFSGFSPSEKDYFITLVNYARAGTSSLKDYLHAKLTSLKRDNENLAKRFENIQTLPDKDAALYYSGWQYLAFHYAISIPKLQMVKALSERFHCSESFAQQTLQALLQMGLVKNDGGKWKMSGVSIHLPRDSAFTGVNHGHWRSRAVQNSFERDPRDVHYTSVGSVSLKDAEALKDMMLTFIDGARKAMGESKEEELFCISCDWFRA